MHAEDEADAADEMSYAEADATYQEVLSSNWANALSQSAANANSPLAAYYAAVAEDKAQELPNDETHVLAEVNSVTQANVALSDGIELAGALDANAAAAAIEQQTDTFAPVEASNRGQSEQNIAQATTDEANAQAAYVKKVAQAAATFYQDKAVATRDSYDEPIAAAGAANEATLAPIYASLFMGTETPQQALADFIAAGVAYNNALNSAKSGVLVGYGDAEITEATTIGDAEVTLATALGLDQTNLVNEQAGLASALATEGAQVDERLVSAVSTANSDEAAAVAQDVAGWTNSAGQAESAAVQETGSDEVDLAGKLAGAEADYAIANAQTEATIAASLAQGTPGGQAAFDALYAQGFVQWLTDLKSSFVSNATAMAQDDAQNRQALETVLDQLANERAMAESNFVISSGSASVGEAVAVATAEDDYQTNLASNSSQNGGEMVATANAGQGIALAQASAAYVLASAKADKDRELNEANGVANWRSIYVDEMADAKLALQRAQADADLNWITSVAQGQQAYLSQDAADWQMAVTQEAQADDQFAHQNNATAQAEADALALAESDTMLPRAQAQAAQTTADAVTAGNFRIAQANESETIWNGIAAQMGTPWAQSQAGLASAEAAWAPLAAQNYQQYASQLGSNLVQYATSNSDQFLSEMTTIDAADCADSNQLADAQQSLTLALGADEAAFEKSGAQAGAGYQQDMAQADHDYRYAMAQANHDLATTGDLAGFLVAVGLAESNRAAARATAVSDFESLVDPAIVLQATNDADARLAQATGSAGAVLDDSLQGNQATHDYADAEAADLDLKQRGDAQALYAYQTADANGHATAISVFAKANPSPWADMAAAQAGAQAKQQIQNAAAQLALSTAAADAQETATQLQADAQKTSDDANAQARHDQAVAVANAAHDEQIAQADVTDAVFALLPDPIAAPDDGTAPILTPDFVLGYEANDFSLRATSAIFGQAVVEFSQGWEGWVLQQPTFMPHDLGQYDVSYDWGGFGRATMPWGLLGNQPDPALWSPTNTGLTSTDTSNTGTPVLTPSVWQETPELARGGGVPLTTVYQIASHTLKLAAAALLVTATESSGESFWDRAYYWFVGRNHTQPKGPPSSSGANSGGVITYYGPFGPDPTQKTLIKTDSKGRMIAKNSLDLENQDIKNSIKFGNFKIAIYEGIADALEDQIWKLATAGVLGDAQSELIQVAVKRTYRVGKDFGKQIIQITVDKVVKRVDPDQIEEIKKVLRDRGQGDKIEDVIEAIKGFAFKALKTATGDARETQRWGEALAKLWKRPAELQKLADKLGGMLHAHHIVMKAIPSNRSQKVQDAISASQKILAGADIRLFENFDDFAKNGTKENAQNFAWALARKDYGLHSDDYALEVHRRLQEAWNSGGKAGVRKELEWMRGELQGGRSFWGKK